jgi:23S rRNA pseudouridine955/2504/2580 synthase
VLGLVKVNWCACRNKRRNPCFQPIKNFDSIDASLVEVLIETGRMHQIRVHAQYVGHPLACDDKYGDREFDREF